MVEVRAIAKYLLILFLLFFAGCREEPVVSFGTDCDRGILDPNNTLTFDTNEIAYLTTDYSLSSRITFYDVNEVGWLDWSTGEFEFRGDLDESAKVFFEYLKMLVDEYIKSETKKQQLIKIEKKELR